MDIEMTELSELDQLRDSVHEITSRALYTADNTAVSGDMLDNYYHLINTKWKSIRDDWIKCLKNNIPKKTFTEMTDSALTALLPNDLGLSERNTSILSFVIRGVVKRCFDELTVDQLIDSIDATYSAVYPLYPSSERYGPKKNPILAQKKTSDTILRYLTNFSQEVCLSVLYFTVLNKMEMNKGTKHEISTWICVCCRDKDLEILLRPCFHRCLCEECYRSLRTNECPLCRAKIVSSLRLCREPIQKRI